MSKTADYIKEKRLTDGTLYPVLVPLNGSLPFRAAIKELGFMPDQDYDVLSVQTLTDQQFREHRLHQLPLQRSQLDLYELWYFPLTPNDYDRAYTMSKTDRHLAHAVAIQKNASELATAAQTGNYTASHVDTPYSY